MNRKFDVNTEETGQAQDRSSEESYAVKAGLSHRKAALGACIVSIAAHFFLIFTLLRMPFVSVEFEADSAEWEGFKNVKIEMEEHESYVGKDEPESTARILPTAQVNTEQLGFEHNAIALPRAEEVLSGRDTVVTPGAGAERSEWVPREEILMIEERIVNDTVSTLPRRLVPLVDRSQKTEDIVLPVDRDEPLADVGSEDVLIAGDTSKTEAVSGIATGGAGNLSGDKKAPETGFTDEKFGEKPEEVSDLKAVEEVLLAETTVFMPVEESGYQYFRIEINRAGEKELPVIPKDIVLVQDCSASITPQRLQFCKNGLSQCLSLIREDDRFNVIAFRKDFKKCFDGWIQKSPDSMKQAKSFIRTLRSGGNTDVYSTIRALTEIEREPGRPAVAILVTDGLPTSGLTDNTDIIGKFSKINDGAMSVFTLGVTGRANTYLLDLLSYSNKGAVYVISRGRWEIPDAIENLMKQVRRPVMADLSFRFAEGLDVEVYPVLSSDLYLDRSLVLYGRYPRNKDRVVFQAVGRGGDVQCDMIFDIDLSQAPANGSREISLEWARQKTYHLHGKFARSADPALVRQLNQTAERYRLKVPYKKQLK